MTTELANDVTGAHPVRSGDWLGRVLVACEYSGSVRDAFAALGWDAWSCDLLPSEKPGKHHQGDVRDVLDAGWDIMIAHPPCTHLAVSGARWFKDKVREQSEALDFVRLLLSAPIPHIALENPVSVISSKIRKPDQVIQPWQHGHGETKATCLWLKNLPLLKPSNIVEGREQRIWKLPPSADRWNERSRTFSGIAKAMATQWTLATRPTTKLSDGRQPPHSNPTTRSANGCLPFAPVTLLCVSESFQKSAT
jgi:site-specific DNA-cytosine methylase